MPTMRASVATHEGAAFHADILRRAPRPEEILVRVGVGPNCTGIGAPQMRLSARGEPCPANPSAFRARKRSGARAAYEVARGSSAAIAISLYMMMSFSVTAFSMPATKADPDPNHPGEVALGNDGGKWSYKSFPALMPLYIFEGDEPGKSRCDVVCAAVWPIIRAPDYAKPVGNWTIVQRDDGRKQWAYKGMPVYTFYDDRPFEPRGDGLEYGWWLTKNDGPHSSSSAKIKSQKSERRPAWRLLVP